MLNRGTCKIRNKIETKRNETKSNQTKPKPAETKRNQIKNGTDQKVTWNILYQYVYDVKSELGKCILWFLMRKFIK